MLSNTRHEKFVQVWHETGNKTEAYRQAFPRSKMWTDASANNKASELSKRDEIAARFKELQEEAAINHEITVEGLVKELNKNLRLARDFGQMGPANQAVMGIAKLCGLDIDKSESKQIIETVELSKEDYAEVRAQMLKDDDC